MLHISNIDWWFLDSSNFRMIFFIIHIGMSLGFWFLVKDNKTGLQGLSQLQYCYWFFFFFSGGSVWALTSAQRLLMALCSETSPAGVQGTMCAVGDQTRVDCMQAFNPSLCDPAVLATLVYEWVWRSESLVTCQGRHSTSPCKPKLSESKACLFKGKRKCVLVQESLESLWKSDKWTLWNLSTSDFWSGPAEDKQCSDLGTVIEGKKIWL